MVGTNGLFRRNVTDPNIIESTEPYVTPTVPYAQFLASKITGWSADTYALIDPYTHAKMTYAKLHEKAQEFASALIELGVTDKDVVCFFADNSFDLTVSLVAVIYLGLTFCPVSPFAGKKELIRSIEQCGGTVLFVGANRLNILDKVFGKPELREHIVRQKLIVELGAWAIPDELWSNEEIVGKTIVTFEQAMTRGMDKQLARIPWFAVEAPESKHFFYAEHQSQIVSGQMKRVIHSHASFHAIVAGSSRRIYEKFKFTQWTPISHYAGMMMLNITLASGITSVLFRTHNLDCILSALQQYRIDILYLSADLGVLMAKVDYRARYDLSSLKIILYGKEKFADSVLDVLMDKYKVKIINDYGSLECLGHLVLDRGELDRAHYHFGSCGQVGPGVQMKIVNRKQKDQTLGAHQPGEICFKAPQVCLGYLDNEAATREVIDEDGWYHTGDIGYYDEEGRLYITEPIKELIRTRAYTIMPADIEDLLLRHEAVAEVCVVGVKHVTDTNWVRAYVQLLPGKSVTEKELFEYVSEHLPIMDALLAGVRFVDEMPLSADGKILRTYFHELVKDEVISDQ